MKQPKISSRQMQKLQNKLNTTLLFYLQKQVSSFFSPLNIIVGESYCTILPDKCIVYIPYYVPKKETNILFTEHKLALLALALSRWLKTKNCEIRLIRLEYPYLDSSVLAKYLAHNANKYNFTQLQKGVLNHISLLSGEDATLTNLKSKKSLFLPISLITGVKMETAGRLTTQRSVPRKTVDNTHSGSFKISPDLGYSISTYQYTSKNKLGAFTMKT